MKIKFIMICLASLLVLSIVSAGMIIPANDNAKENARAPEKSHVIDENWGLERIDFIHYAKPSNPGIPNRQTTCYKLMGVKWKFLPVNYVINPNNNYGLSENFITNAVSTGAETWDSSTASELFNIPVIDYSAQYGIQNFENAIVFGDYPEAGVIGVTSVWFTRKGKQIVEFDIILNTDYVWGDATQNPNAMDLENIAIHELGHSIGLDDIYSESCSEVTMYGYSTEGEIKKRSLEQADILGIKQLYG